MQSKIEMVTTLYHRPRRLLLDTQLNGSSSSSNGSRPPHTSLTNEASFDTNMVIVLAALLCALICALGLNSIMRCAFRCGRRFGFNAPEVTGGRLTAGTGLKKSALRRIPVAVYSSGTNMKATDCPICLGEFMDGEKVRVLPKCNHGFHVRCIDTWLMSHSSCPTCRRSLLDQPTSGAASTDIEAGIRQHGNSSGGGGQADVPVAADEVG